MNVRGGEGRGTGRENGKRRGRKGMGARGGEGTKEGNTELHTQCGLGAEVTLAMGAGLHWLRQAKANLRKIRKKALLSTM